MQLLVSVRNVTEADAALAGGADIIDVKEPGRGSLGMADTETIRAVMDRCRQQATDVLCSAALGELPEWSEAPAGVVFGAHQQWARGLNYLKVGLSGTRSSPAWIDQWLDFRSRFPDSVEWVAVAYADAERAAAPPVERVAEAAGQSQCRVLLLDTFCKDATNLFDWIAPDALCRLRVQCHDSGLRLALAGRIEMRHLPWLIEINPDLLAVRGAVCEAGERTSTITASRVRDLRSAMP